MLLVEYEAEVFIFSDVLDYLGLAVYENSSGFVSEPVKEDVFLDWTLLENQVPKLLAYLVARLAHMHHNCAHFI